ncbi:Alpha/Beta hydrolase protein [Aspergillus pseudonomiae]|uniref:Carboxylic ester hydrolase n=1 Tax=Aspergillus pseudonomiae TaxID=1506151 RepID=A0A5N7D4J1_9EURO|nr:Alpha/Beta hydrolase protein [Aspergillus pseudonomiae]KAE8400773.1 Alpha/Beta hydrolase protein [Aspergillus pseudonomiae]
MRLVLLHFLIYYIVQIIALGDSQYESQPMVTVKNGTILGSKNNPEGIQRFLGIPYAQPPIGPLRLRQAVPLNASFGTLNATTMSPACYGKSNSKYQQSEDCLTLNVWQPDEVGKNASSPLVPVLVWLYGGGLTGGYIGDPRFDGANIVALSAQIKKPVIFVSINYRLASLGFLNGRQMAELGLLNIGMLDQRRALHWLQENIAFFGGDPKKVTLFGESAGAVSIYSHMMAYGGRDDGLFRGAILESGGAFPLTLPNTTSFQQTFDSLITNTSCSTLTGSTAAEQLDCIRALPIDTFLSSVGDATGQSIDGSFTTTSVQFAFPAGEYVKVATIVGTNTDEGTTSAPTGIDSMDELMDPLADGYFRPERLPDSMVKDLLSLYTNDPREGCPYNTGDVMLSSGILDKKACSIFGDMVQIGPARMIAEELTKHNGDKPVYRYRFNQLPANSSEPSAGVTTGTEIPYIFSNLIPDVAWERALASEMTKAWVSFAYDLNPNANEDTALPFWPVYGENKSSMVFNAYGCTIEHDTYRPGQISYIIGHVLRYGAR